MPLSRDQESARDIIYAALRKGTPEVTLAGAAGTGKTTLLRTIVADLSKERHIILLAPTGKAAHRLSQVSGLQVNTIHSALYGRVLEDGEGNPLFSEAKEYANKGDLVIVDEGTMVGGEVAGDLRSKAIAGTQILVAGDHEQLPPVDDTWGFDLRHATATLTEVQRTALDSPILKLATAWRLGKIKQFNDFEAFEHPKCKRVPLNFDVVARSFANLINSGADATLLTWENEYRVRLNAAVRGYRGPTFQGICPVPGDILICLMNNRRLGINNGQTMEVEKVKLSDPMPELLNPVVFDVRFKGSPVIIRVPQQYLGSLTATKDSRKQGMAKRRDIGVFDLGYCSTIHRSQGSEWGTVGLVLTSAVAWLRKTDPETYRRLVYTGITRAKERLVLFTGSGV